MGSPLYVVLVELLASIMSTPLYSWGDGGPETEGGACAIARRWWVMGKEWRLSVVWYPRHLHSPPHLAWWPQELRNWNFTEVKMVLPVKSTVWSMRQLGTRQMEPSLLALSSPRSLSSETSWVRIIEFGWSTRCWPYLMEGIQEPWKEPKAGWEHQVVGKTSVVGHTCLLVLVLWVISLALDKLSYFFESEFTGYKMRDSI